MNKFNKMDNPTLTYETTSLGVIEKNFIQDLYLSFCPKKSITQEIKFRLVYPTKKYIEQETGGQASVLFLTAQNWKKSDSKGILHKYDTNPLNPILGCIPHLKTIVLEEENSNKCILYVGSHNMTKAAWGRF